MVFRRQHAWGTAMVDPRLTEEIAELAHLRERARIACENARVQRQRLHATMEEIHAKRRARWQCFAEMRRLIRECSGETE